ncbi:MAG: hypothetical protein LUD83_03990 [Clostridiales bacterium]|nr:hypothetical protein [Clostridiales bacterium]
MDNPLPRGEHEEFRRTVDAEFERIRDEDARQNRRLELLENSTQQVTKLANSVQQLATNMEGMLREQTKQGERLKALEGRDGEKWREAVKIILTALAGVLVGALCTQFGIT